MGFLPIPVYFFNNTILYLTLSLSALPISLPLYHITILSLTLSLSALPISLPLYHITILSLTLSLSFCPTYLSPPLSNNNPVSDRKKKAFHIREKVKTRKEKTTEKYAKRRC